MYPEIRLHHLLNNLLSDPRVVSVTAVTKNLSILTEYINCLHFTGAVALESTNPSSSHRFVNAELKCSGLESKITSCIQNLDEAYSCLSFGIASISCYGKILLAVFVMLI